MKLETLAERLDYVNDNRNTMTGKEILYVMNYGKLPNMLDNYLLHSRIRFLYEHEDFNDMSTKEILSFIQSGEFDNESALKYLGKRCKCND